MTVLVITGTGTGVGKTIVTAALASYVPDAGGDVAVCKPVQTGDDDDLAEIARLSGVRERVSVARYPDALAPVAAAAAVGRSLPSAEQIVDAVRSVDQPGRLTLVEGAGGLLVELATAGVTLRELAVELDAPVLVVCAAGLGTLNHTALTLEALENRGISCAGLVIGSWPTAPGMAEEFNHRALANLAPLRAVLPADAAALSRADFAVMAGRAFDPDWVAGLS